METKSARNDSASPGTGDWRIVVHSIGEANAGIIGALKAVSPLSESRLAALVYQAPSELMRGLSRETAEQINALLGDAGLESAVLADDASFASGDADHEVALVIDDVSRMSEIVRLVIEVLGVDLHEARRLLCASPAVLMGRISANTVAALRERFARVGVALDVSRSAEAVFDLFLGECAPRGRARVLQVLGDLGIQTVTQAVAQAEETHPQPLLALGLAKADADRLWDRLRRTGLPFRLINRDFERFDVRLDEAPASPEMQALLVSMTGMPEHVAARVVAETPIVIAQNVPFAAMRRSLDAVAELDGRASGHLLAFQSFSVVVEQCGDRAASERLLALLGGLEAPAAARACDAGGAAPGAMPNLQARWLAHELARVGTRCRVVVA